MSIVLGLDTSTTACSAAVLMNGSVKAARFEEMMHGQA
ncbi:MAG: tRNA A37 threonylcarbamoyladenosine modification protein TsaB, partial [Alphaproteobacteria bacterium]